MLPQIARSVGRVRGLFGCFLQQRRKVAPKSKRDKELREDVHRADEHVNRIVKQRRPAMFEILMPDNLQCPADNDQQSCDDPDPGYTHMVDNRGGDKKKWNGRTYDRHPDADIPCGP